MHNGGGVASPKRGRQIAGDCRMETQGDLSDNSHLPCLSEQWMTDKWVARMLSNVFECEVVTPVPVRRNASSQ